MTGGFHQPDILTAPLSMCRPDRCRDSKDGDGTLRKCGIYCDWLLTYVSSQIGELCDCLVEVPRKLFLYLSSGRIVSGGSVAVLLSIEVRERVKVQGPMVGSHTVWPASRCLPTCH